VESVPSLCSSTQDELPLENQTYQAFPPGSVRQDEPRRQARHRQKCAMREAHAIFNLNRKVTESIGTIWHAGRGHTVRDQDGTLFAPHLEPQTNQRWMNVNAVSNSSLSATCARSHCGSSKLLSSASTISLYVALQPASITVVLQPLKIPATVRCALATLETSNTPKP
jgi:hypothetical protein